MIDFFAAMRAAAEEHSNVIVDNSDGTFDCAAWWRGGDDPHVRVWQGGSFNDVVTGEGGNATRFAELAFGCSLKEFLDRFSGAEETPERTRPRTARRSEPLAEQTWSRLDADPRRGCPEPPNFAQAWKWFTDVRGLPQVASAMARGEIASVDVGDAAAFPPALRSWVKRQVTVNGSAVAFPLRGSSGETRSLYLRFTAPIATKGAFLPGTRKTDADGVPRGYGAVGRALRATTLVVTEGAPDALIARALIGKDRSSAVVGALDAGQMRGAWSKWLASRRDGIVVVVPHLDGDNASDDGVGQQAARALVAALRLGGTAAAIFPWRRFRRALAAGGVVDDIRDLGDFAVAAVAARITWPIQQRLFKAALGASDADKR